MKFLVDAHLPRGLCALLARHGHDAIHTRDLPDQNATKDRVINQISIEDQRVVISKIRAQNERSRFERRIFHSLTSTAGAPTCIARGTGVRCSRSRWSSPG
ncbi:MAG TPA: DUF5615 family PIN-like protein [Verrucomicrobiae bacterium]|nr:DUF5615 family PIN-like protein [Verrucomicrobiae bacterium]